MPAFCRLFGDSILTRTRDLSRRRRLSTRPFAFIALHPFAAKRGTKLGDVPSWLLARRAARGQSPAYANPDGFIEVTQGEHGHPRLRAFPACATSSRTIRPTSGRSIWCCATSWSTSSSWSSQELQRERHPREAHVGHERLPDAAVQRERRRHRRPRRAQPAHVRRRVGRLRRQRRQTAGWTISTATARIDFRDAQVIADAVDRVERAASGAGRRRRRVQATRAHGPFAHIDVRGNSRALGPAVSWRMIRRAAARSSATRIDRARVSAFAAIIVVGAFRRRPVLHPASPRRPRRSRDRRARRSRARRVAERVRREPRSAGALRAARAATSSFRSR